MFSKISLIITITVSLSSLSHIHASEINQKEEYPHHIALHLKEDQKKLVSLYQEHTLKGKTFSLDLNHSQQRNPANDYSFEEFKRDIHTLWGEQPIQFPVHTLKLCFFPKGTLPHIINQKYFPYLTGLDLKYYDTFREYISDELIECAPHLEQLTSLNLERIGIGTETTQAISRHMTNLTSLNLSFGKIGNEGILAISNHLTNLTDLDISYNDISYREMSYMCRSLPKLTALNLGNINLPSKDLNHKEEKDRQSDLPHLLLKDIVRFLPHITKLNMERWPIGNDGSKIIAQLTNLRELCTNYSHININELVESLKNLERLDVGYCGVNISQVKEIIQALPNLTWIYISCDSYTSGLNMFHEIRPNLTVS